MPKIYINYPQGAFPENAIDSLADEITNCAPKFEKLPDTPYVRSNIWIYASEYAADRVYHGGNAGGTKVISFEVNVIEGGLDAEAKKLTPRSLKMTSGAGSGRMSGCSAAIVSSSVRTCSGSLE
jgi:hypothetical protein